MFKVRLKNMRFFDRTFTILAPLARFLHWVSTMSVLAHLIL